MRIFCSPCARFGELAQSDEVMTSIWDDIYTEIQRFDTDLESTLRG
jgi:hypothetical protein